MVTVNGAISEEKQIKWQLEFNQLCLRGKLNKLICSTYYLF